MRSGSPFGVSPLDPGVWLTVIGAIAVVAMAAIAAPARQAARVAPTVALRE